MADRWAASIINPTARNLYQPTVGGLVLAPTARLWCAYPEDGNSMLESKTCARTPPPLPPLPSLPLPHAARRARRLDYIRTQQPVPTSTTHPARGAAPSKLPHPGCTPGCFTKSCTDMGREHNAYSCSFWEEELELALRAQQERESMRNRNNEMVVDTRTVVDARPLSVEAFFYRAGSPASDIDMARRVRRARLESSCARPHAHHDGYFWT